jgi:hypothetical protein
MSTEGHFERSHALHVRTPAANEKRTVRPVLLAKLAGSVLNVEDRPDGKCLNGVSGTAKSEAIVDVLALGDIPFIESTRTCEEPTVGEQKGSSHRLGLNHISLSVR